MLPASHESASSGDSTSWRVSRALEGDHESLGWIVARFSPLLRSQVVYRLSTMPLDTHDVDDIVAEAWLVALRRLHEIVPPGGRRTPRLLAFLSTTTLHILNHRLDARIRQNLASAGTEGGDSQGGDPMDQQAAEITGVVTRAVRSEVNRSIEDALAKLPQADREVLVLRGIEGLSNREIAEKTGEPANNISHRYSRAMAKLRDRLPDSIFSELIDG